MITAKKDCRRSPRALVITRNLPPLIGGMENLVWRLVNSVAAEYETRVVGPKGSTASRPDGTRIAEVPHRPLAIFLVRAFFAAIRTVIGWRPDVVVAGSGLTAPVAWMIGRTTRGRVVVYVHGLDIEARSRIYQALWLPFIRHADTVIANSYFSAGLAEGRGVDQDRLTIIHPGTTLPAIGNADKNGRSFRERYGFTDSRILLFVGRITERKGLAPFCEKILPNVMAAFSDVHLVVIGDHPSDSILYESSNVRENLEICLQKLELNRHVTFLGSLSDKEVSQAYFAADLHIFPVQESAGSSEGFGMVALEAAAHGTPTVAYAAGGVGDAIGHGCSGYLVKPGDEISFTHRVIEVLDGSADELSPRVFAEAFSWDRFAQDIRNAIARKDKTYDNRSCGKRAGDNGSSASRRRI